MEQIKVKELYELCKAQIEKGNGDKYIVVADDNEGNGYHGMFFGFSEDVEDYIDLINDSQIIAADKLIILG
jgi:hypothetical protein